MKLTEKKITDDEKFLKNVKEARANGFDLVCAECGVGLFDDSDEHELFCTQNPDYEENLKTAERWAEKQRAKQNG